MDQTCIDVALDTFYNLVKVKFLGAHPDVDVLDGPSIDDIGQDVVAIGISAEDLSMDSSFETAGLRTDRETFDLVCLVRSWNGDADLAPRRARAFELFRSIGEIVKTNPRLDNTVARARIAGISYTPARLPEGAVASLTFRVRIEAFTS